MGSTAQPRKGYNEHTINQAKEVSIMASKSRGWKSPDPAKKRRKEKARKHAAPKVPRPKPRGLPDEDREKVRVASLLSRGAAEIVYEPTHPAPLPVPGVVAGGCHEAKDPVPKWERKALRKTIASIKGPPAPKAVNWRDNTEPDNIVRISRKGNAICVPRKSERLVQEVLVKIHSTLKPTEKTNPVKIERVNLNRMEERVARKKCLENSTAYLEMLAKKEAYRELKADAHEALPGDWGQKTSYERKLAMTGKLVRNTNPDESKFAKEWAAARKELKKERREKAAKLTPKAVT